MTQTNALLGTLFNPEAQAIWDKIGVAIYSKPADFVGELIEIPGPVPAEVLTEFENTLAQRGFTHVKINKSAGGIVVTAKERNIRFGQERFAGVDKYLHHTRVKLSDLVNGQIIDKRHLGLTVQRLGAAITAVDPELADAIITSGRYTILISADDLPGIQQTEADNPMNGFGYGRLPFSGHAPKMAVFSDEFENGILLTYIGPMAGEEHRIGTGGFINSMLNKLIGVETSELGFGH